MVLLVEKVGVTVFIYCIVSEYLILEYQILLFEVLSYIYPVTCIKDRLSIKLNSDRRSEYIQH